jgi:DNA-directed RNA polymerase subunit beta'
VEELFEARVPKGQAVVSDIDGLVEIVREDETVRLRVSKTEVFEESIDLGAGFEASVKNDAVVREGHVVATRPDPVQANGEDNAPTELKAPISGKLSIDGRKITIRREESDSVQYPIVVTARLSVSDGDEVVRGQRLTEGPLNPHDILRTRGEADLHRYLLSEIQSVYRIVGVPVHDKHIEIVIRQMLRKVLVDEAGDTEFLPGELIDRMRFGRTNEATLENGAEIARGTPVLLGVTKASLNTESFLAAASFQDTTRVLTEAAILGSTDRLRGLKENVIIGKLIPAGTGFMASMADFTVPVDDGDTAADGDSNVEDVFAKVEGSVPEKALPGSDGEAAANGQDQALIASDAGADSDKENAGAADDGA